MHLSLLLWVSTQHPYALTLYSAQVLSTLCLQCCQQAVGEVGDVVVVEMQEAMVVVVVQHDLVVAVAMV